MEALFARLGLEVTYTATQEIKSLHPGRTALISLGDQVIGVLGQVHPVTAKAYDIPETYVAELNLSAIEAALQPAAAFVEITKFPAVSRDIALLLKAEVTHQEVVDAIQAYSLTFQNPEDSLTDEEVARYMEKIQASLEEKVDAEVR